MKLPFRFAFRYLFARKRTHAINIITWVAELGLAIGTAALILVMSVFNGFEDLIMQLFSNFNPDIKVTPAEGKTFAVDSSLLLQLEELEGIAFVSQSLEEIAFFEYGNSQAFGILKGVDDNYRLITGIDSTVREGHYQLRGGEDGRNLVVAGVGMRNKLSINIDNPLTPLYVYMPRRKKVSAIEQPFRKKLTYPVGTFVIQQDFDNRYVLADLRFVQELLKKQGQLSALEIAVAPEADMEQLKEEIKRLLGPDFEVKDRYEQDEAFLKLLRIEKWMSYAILSLTMALVAFNMIGALWMIVLEKKRDIAMLKAMGADEGLIRRIFLSQGVLMSVLGLLVGFAIAVVLYLLHTHLENGLVSIPQGFVVSAYPVQLRLSDFVLVGITVIFIGLLASLLPAKKAKDIPAIIRTHN